MFFTPSGFASTAKIKIIWKLLPQNGPLKNDSHPLKRYKVMLDLEQFSPINEFYYDEKKL